MSDTINFLKKEIQSNNLHFTKKPILIGGLAMQYYSMRKSGEDIDFVICDEDYQTLASKNPDKRKDIWGDLGVVIGIFEIWRSIALLDYDFYLKDAIDEGEVLVVSLDRLMLMRVITMDSEKYMKDLKMIKEHYFKTFTNQEFKNNQSLHLKSYEKENGTIFGGKYND